MAELDKTQPMEDESDYGRQHMAEDPELDRDGDQPPDQQPGVFEAFGPETNREGRSEEAGDIIERCRRKAAAVSRGLNDEERHALEFILNSIEDNFSYDSQEPWRGYASRLISDVLDEYSGGNSGLASDNLADLRHELEEQVSL